MFRPANHNSRFPSVVQPYTKENLIFQLALAVVFVGGMIAKDAIEDRMMNRRYKKTHPID